MLERSPSQQHEDPLTSATLRRLREGAEEAMQQARRFQCHRLKAGLLQLREDLAARVRCWFDDGADNAINSS